MTFVSMFSRACIQLLHRKAVQSGAFVQQKIVLFGGFGDHKYHRCIRIQKYCLCVCAFVWRSYTFLNMHRRWRVITDCLQSNWGILPFQRLDPCAQFLRWQVWIHLELIWYCIFFQGLRDSGFGISPLVCCISQAILATSAGRPVLWVSWMNPPFTRACSGEP